MQKWKEYKLSQVAYLVKNTFKPNAEESLPYIGLEHIAEQQLRLNSVGHSSEVISNKFYFEPNDVLFGKLRPYFRKVVQPKFKGVCSTDIWVLRAKEGFDQDFLYYFFANKDFVDLSSSVDTGTRMPRADWDYLKDTDWLLPTNIEEQRQIGFILKCLHKKIDLLQRNSDSLEELAQVIFRQWFLEEEKHPKLELSVFTNHLKKSVNPQKFPSKIFSHYSIPAFDNEQQPDVILGKDIKSNKYLVKSNTILVSKLNPQFPRIWLIHDEPQTDDSICSTEFQVVEPKDNKYLGYIYCFLKSKQIIGELAQATGGTSGSHQRIDPKDIFKLLIPDVDKTGLEKFNEITNPFWDKINNNKREINSLRKLRENYLPKLMSGEIRVKM